MSGLCVRFMSGLGVGCSCAVVGVPLVVLISVRSASVLGPESRKLSSAKVVDGQTSRSTALHVALSPALLTTIDDIERSVRSNSQDAAALQAARHTEARERCSNSSRSYLHSGGWCLRQMVRQQRYGVERVVHLHDGSSYKMPSTHVDADRLILQLLRDLTNGYRQSVLDLGAGVGQYGHALVAKGLKWRGYDGAGDVEDYTDGYVKYADLTAPLSLHDRADWVMCLEVGEHVPRASELMLIRNLHAHNRCGILLSWACCVSGSGHINRRPNSYIIDIFDRLGYALDAERTRAVRNVRLREALGRNQSNHVYGWFSTSLMLFVRREPLLGSTCGHITRRADSYTK